MSPLFYYLLKVILCSGVLFTYYWLALRNKAFHQWNRFYLLIAVVLSLVLPFIHIDISGADHSSKAIHLLQVVTAADEYMVVASGRTFFSAEQWVIIGCIAVSLLLFFQLLSWFVKVSSIKQQYPVQQVEDVLLINTDVKETPFSFLNMIFWNKEIDIQSPTGQLILKHELIHVKEKHTLDKIFIQLVLVACWCNPFFWIIRNELKMIHEFIADKKSVKDQDTSLLAAMILQTVYPAHYPSIINAFFQTSIKRRLRMLTKNQNPKFRYIGRIVALPLLAAVVLAFTLKTKTIASHLLLTKEITVVIDAGHGGTETGATYDNTHEDEVTLSISKQVLQMNTNDKIKIIMTRDKDELIAIKDRVQIASENKADLFISIHTNAAMQEDSTGMEVLVSGKNPFYQAQSELLGSILVEELNTAYHTFPQLKTSNTGVWIIDHNICPAVLIECGYLSNTKDRAFIMQISNQQAVAKKILSSIERYALANNTTATVRNTATLPTVTNPTSANDTTTPKQYYKGKEVVSINVKKETKQIVITYGDGSEETMSIEQAKKIKLLTAPPPPPPAPSVQQPAPPPPPPPVAEPSSPSLKENFKGIYILDGKPYTGKMEDIKPETIESMNVLKGSSATNKYGEKGKNGVIEITTKSKAGTTKEATPQPSPSGGGTMNVNTITFSEAKKYNVPVIIDEKFINSTINDLKIAQDDIKTIMFATGEPIIAQYGDKAKDGVIIINTKKFAAEQEKNRSPETRPVFTQTEVEPKFPGGTAEWRTFLQKDLDASAPVKHGAPEGSYTVIVQFIVDKEGNVSDIKPMTNKGYGMEEEVVKLIKNGPKWVPAEQNGNKVTSYRKQPVTFVVSAG